MLTLGLQLIDWIETFCVHGPGDVEGQPVVLDDEFAAFITRAYQLDADGKRRVRRAVISRPKGRAKSELAAFLAVAEAIGPVRFDHFAEAGEVSPWGYQYAEGEPVGKPVQRPEVLCFATELGQAGNTYDAIYYMLNPETGSPALVDTYGRIDVGLMRILLPGGGVISPESAADSSKDGGKSTFAVFDEALTLDTPLPTPSGWTTMGEVAEGDWLIGSSGQPVKVVKATSEMKDRHVYRVTFEDGTSIKASAGHLWMTRRCGSAALPKVRTTEEMFTDGTRFRIPVNRPWELPHVNDLPVDPYVLGAWLGDGSTGQPNMTASWDDAPWMVEQLKSRGVTDARATGKPDKAARIYLSRRTGFQRGTELGESLRSMACFRSKHVPAQYLRASIEQRTQLLRGLMDTDGHVTAKGNCTFVGRKELADGVVELLRSLGQVANSVWIADDRSRDGGYVKVHFTPRHGLMPFAMPRKAERVKTHNRGADWVTIKSIELMPTEPVKCVAVASQDHLFVAGHGCHVTHNTHLWVLPKLKRLHQVVIRNLLKRKIASGWALETTTMFAPGEQSVAEGSFEYYRAVSEGRVADAGLLFDHKQAAAKWSVKNKRDRLAGLREVYGPEASEWMDLEAIADSYDDPQTSEAEWLRYWFNQPVSLQGQWLPQAAWDECQVARPIPDGAEVVLALDGSFSGDSTALVAVEMGEFPHVDVAGHWERSPGAMEWRVDILEVENQIRTACLRWQVREITADPHLWARSLQILHEEGLPVTEFPQSPSRMTPATKRFTDMVNTRAITHSGHPALTRHVSNAVLRQDSRGWRLSKESKSSQRHIDLAVAAVMATERAVTRIEDPVAPEVNFF